MAAAVKFRRTRTVRNIGGIRGLAVRVEGARETIEALAQLPTAVQRRVLRQGMAAAARPVAQALKKGAQSAAKQSRRKEGIGTTARSITSKVATSKRDPSIAYALVGAKRGYHELVSLVDPSKRSEVGAIRRLKRRKKGSPLEYGDLRNLGSLARKARLNPGAINKRTGWRASEIKRVPSRYLHLFEKRGAPSGRFMDKVARASANQSMRAFNRIFFAGINREFAKRAAK